MDATHSNGSSQPKKRRRRSSGRYKRAAKELVQKSKASLLSQLTDDSEEETPKHRSPSIPPVDPPSIRIDLATTQFASIHKPQKPSAKVDAPSKRRTHTVSVAIPGTLVNNAQTWELKTALVGQIARACAIYSVDEIIIFDENLPESEPSSSTSYGRCKYRSTEDTDLEAFNPSHFMARILEYLECPQYLRKSLFPLHPDLRLAGLLAPLDLPHHFRKDHLSPWREGCVLPHQQVENYLSGHHHSHQKKKNTLKNQNLSSVWVDVGLDEPVEVQVDENTKVDEWNRVTVQMATSEHRSAKLVSPRIPIETSGVYWGYSIRLASSISKVFTESPYLGEAGYDLTIGTSERGQSVDEALDQMSDFKHLLLVLGGLSGLELCIAADSTLSPRLSADDAPLLFDHWVNMLPCQGSRTIRTEEALLVSLGALRHLLFRGQSILEVP